VISSSSTSTFRVSMRTRSSSQPRVRISRTGSDVGGGLQPWGKRRAAECEQQGTRRLDRIRAFPDAALRDGDECEQWLPTNGPGAAADFSSSSTHSGGPFYPATRRCAYRSACGSGLRLRLLKDEAHAQHRGGSSIAWRGVRDSARGRRIAALKCRPSQVQVCSP
jgi:hypothetical protein